MMVFVITDRISRRLKSELSRECELKWARSWVKLEDLVALAEFRAPIFILESLIKPNPAIGRFVVES
jgi:hypothetical protein